MKRLKPGSRGIQDRGRAGSSLLLVIVLTTAMAVLSLTLLTSVSSSTKERATGAEEADLTYLCEAGINSALSDLATGGDGNLGTEDNPVDFGSGDFFVTTVDQGSGQYELSATGSNGRRTASVKVVVQAQAQSVYQWAAFGETGVTMDSNAMTDSYDSTLGTYMSQRVNGSGISSWANESGHVGSNHDIAIASNSAIHGNAVPGPGGTATAINKSFITGTSLPATSPLTLDPINPPIIPSSGDLSFSGSVSIPSGDHAFDTVTMDSGARLAITGPATIRITDLTISSNCDVVIDATNGPVEFYVDQDFIIGSNATIASTTYDPMDVAFYLSSDNIIDPGVNVQLNTVELNSNADLYGTIYAPEAFINIDSAFYLYGSLVAKRVHLDSNSRIHFDENLLNAGGGQGQSYDLLFWKVIASPES